MHSHPQYEYELSRLTETLDYLKQYMVIIAKRKKNIDVKVEYALKHFNDENAEQFTEVHFDLTNQEYLTQKLKDLEKAQSKPYFSRVDFKPDDEDGEQKLYIGKMTLMREEDDEILITDWRSPVATLYYEGRIGDASYTCPDGEITGEITLKRQYMIEDGMLNDITDIDITTNDEFLQAALGSNKDNRLKDIVSTIQSEQNKIIRADMYRPLIVQGAAGGGKTTIALHRIAYLLYNYENKIKPKNIMIMAPSRFFLSYISEVLPDLGVENVIQTTFEDFAMEYIDQKLKIKPAYKTLAAVVEGGLPEESLEAPGLKSVLRFKTLLERYYEFILKKILPDKDYEIEGYVIIDREYIKNLYLNEYSYLPIAKRLKEIKKNLSNSLKRDKPWILEKINADYDGMKEDIKKQMPDGDERRNIITRLLAERDAKLKAVMNRSKTAVKNYLNNFKLLPSVKYYTILFQNEKLLYRLARNIFTAEECSMLVSQTIDRFKEGFIDSEDLTAVMFLHSKIYGGEDISDIKHIVIDEAQDFSMFQLSVLRDIIKSNSFSILGDLYQGIYYYKGIKSWYDIDKTIFTGNSQYMTLEQSYRTTVEIMDAANKVSECMKIDDIPKAKPVIRHGNVPELFPASSADEAAGIIKKLTAKYEKAGSKSIAIICKTMKECKELSKKIGGISILSGNENNYSGGVNIIPSYLVKGLEFDAVIIANASNDVYTKNELDIKLLYVAMTRPLHELAIIHVGEASHALGSER